ncbi:MAG: YceI family protein [Hyphomicrobiaceae bacterium]
MGPPGMPIKALLTLALLAMASVAARADTYVFDKGHTSIRFAWNHLGLSRPSGRFMDFDGRLEFDPTQPEKGRVEVTIKVASVWTGVAALDDHLKKADYFDAERFPTIHFKSTGVRKTGDKTGEVAGDLTIMGITKPVTLQVTWNFTGPHPLASLNPKYKGVFASGFSARTTIRRSEWGIKRSVPLVSDEILIEIETELSRKEG